MAHSLKQIKNRIRSIENTKKVTAALELISVAKLNRIDKLFFAFRPYFSRLEEMINNLSGGQESIESPFFKKHESQEVCLCLITSDTGLCGTYNNNILQAADDFISKQGKDKVKLLLIGKKGFNYFKKSRIEIFNSYIGLNGRYSDEVCTKIKDELVDIFLSGKVGEINIAYTHYTSALLITPVVRKFLAIEKKEAKPMDYIFEPDKKALIDELIPYYIWARLKSILLEAFTSEHAARTVAMKSATDNAKELLEKLKLERNKVRQANITQDIMEIISSAEALKG